MVVDVDALVMNPIGLQHLLEVYGCENGLNFHSVLVDFSVEDILVVLILRCD